MLQIQLGSMTKISLLFAFFVSIHANLEETGPKNNSTSAMAVPEEPDPGVSASLKKDLCPDSKSVKFGSKIPLTCNVVPSEEGAAVSWTKERKDFTDPGINYSNSTATIEIEVDSENDTVSYTCEARPRKGILINKMIDTTLVPEPGKVTGGYGARAKLNESATLSCQLQGYPLSNFKWVKIDDPENSHTDSLQIDGNRVIMTLTFESVTRGDNGTYQCSADAYEGKVISDRCDLIVVEVPEISIKFAKAVGMDKVYLNWTVNDWNEPVQKYFIEYSKNGTENWTLYSEEITGGNSSYILKGLEKVTDYQFRISASNAVGGSTPSIATSRITTLEEDPVFIPAVSIRETDMDSVMIDWQDPPKEMRDQLYYYEIMVTRGNKMETYYSPVQPANVYKLHNLEFDITTYRLCVKACNNYTRQCGDWGPSIEVQILGGNSQSTFTAGLQPALNLISLYLVIKSAVV